jgi:hypothetical protein
MSTFIRTTFNYIKLFIIGTAISTSCVLVTNDIFYNTFFRRVTKINTEFTENSIWQEIKPREIFGKGAKSTFIKHKIESKQNDESNTYHQYVDNLKYQESNKPNTKDDLYKNIFNKKI